MASLDKINIAGQKQDTFEISEELFQYPCNQAIVHACVLAQLANKRQGTACTKTKGEVKASRAKPWRQKGTGRARAGYKTSPIWRGGGVAFGPKPRSYNQKINRKTRRKALFGVIADKMREGKVCMIENWDLEKPNTKVMVALKDGLGSRKMLCIGSLEDKNAYLSSRNLTNSMFLDIDSINVYDLVNSTELIISEPMMKVIEERFEAVKQFAKEK